MEDNTNNNGQIIQDVERELQCQNTKVKTPLQSLYTNEQRFNLIKPMFNTVVSQMNIINSCFTVHARIAFTEKEMDKLPESVTGIPQQLTNILVESVNIRNNLIDIIGAMERLSDGITRFVKIANNPKLMNKPITKYLHFIERPMECLKVLIKKKCELDPEKVENLEKNLTQFMENSGSKAVPGWMEDQSRSERDLETLEKKRHEIVIEDIAECNEVSRIISEIEFYQTKLNGHEHLKKDLQNEKKILQDNRDYLENHVLSFVTSSRIVKAYRFMWNSDLEVLRKQKMLVKEEISEITSQENLKILDEAECKEALRSRLEMLEIAKNKVELIKANRESKLKKIDEDIEKKKEDIKKFENKIDGILKKYGNPSIGATYLMLDSIAKLGRQRVDSNGIFNICYNSVNNFLGKIEGVIDDILLVEGARDELDDDWLSTLETSILPLKFFVSELQPIISDSIQGISPKKLISYSTEELH
ncbi:16522_t:CDS:2 [Acaulospora morrowiae]|uniref:16522_t:CDS:1 n=1 Tax=Acaulospora morrowiae TaxID=94023 RepID=A0A9N9HG58_9GLOM|nr:16522_t:CDS:2 [Acaulospora morrowiae]